MAWGLDLGTALVPSDGSAVAGDAALHMTDWITSGDFSISGKFQHTYIYSNQALLSEEGVSSSTGAYLGTSTDTGFSVIIFIIAGTVYTSTYPIAQDEWVEFSLVLVGTTLTFTVNGNSNSVTLIVNPLTFNKWGVGSAYQNTSHHVLAGQWIFETNATQRIYDFDASNHGLGQPVVTETVGGLNATGQLFPEDGSSWIDFGGGTPDIPVSLLQYADKAVLDVKFCNVSGVLNPVDLYMGELLVWQKLPEP